MLLNLKTKRPSSSTVFRFFFFANFFFNFLFLIIEKKKKNCINYGDGCGNAERAPELSGIHAHIFYPNDIRRNKASLCMRWSWISLHRHPLFLLQRLLNRQPRKPPQDRVCLFFYFFNLPTVIEVKKRPLTSVKWWARLRWDPVYSTIVIKW